MEAVILLLALAALVALVAPLAWVPAVALIAQLVVPYDYIAGDVVVESVSPSVVLAMIYLVRAIRDARQRGESAGRVEYALPAAIVLLGVALAAVGGESDRESIARSAAFVALIGLTPYFRRHAGHAAQTLRACWLLVAIVLGAYAVLEKFVLESNPVAAVINGGTPLVAQTWSTYRVTTVIGHPLLNMMFFGVSCAVSLSEFNRRPRSLPLAAASLSIAGVLCTASRSGLLVIAVAVAWAAVTGWRKYAANASKLLFVVLPAAALGVVVVGVTLGTRVGSDEAATSSSYRNVIAGAGLTWIGQAPLTGRGLSSLAEVSALAGLPNRGNFENSYLDLALAAGVVTLAGVVGACLLTMLVGGRGDKWSSSGVMLTYLVAAGSFNLWFGYPAWLGFVPIIAVAMGEAPARADGQQAVESPEHTDLFRRRDLS